MCIGEAFFYNSILDSCFDAVVIDVEEFSFLDCDV